ncbi:MAG TPA: acyl-CoA dehydrogenase family protein [Mycobacteriales bacterium]|nr:acyl-CoA dehydrogenase family protein [Mycobacteriales bacterium]
MGVAGQAEVDAALAALLGSVDLTGDPTAFLGAQYDAGLAWVSFPVGLGGLGISVEWQAYVNERVAAAGGPSGFAGNPLGYGMGGPTVLAHGTPEQQQRLLRPLFTGEEIWCQLFSEPSAGSDLANVSTRARQDGDEWVIDGQKVWTSWGHVARWGMLLARTDPDVPKHRGLTYFVCDMQAPGVEVRPLRQMTGNAEFNEVYFTEARISDAMRLDVVGGGWGVALTTLSNERYMLSEGLSAEPALAAAVELWRARVDQDSAEAVVLRDRLVDLHVRIRANRLTMRRGDALRDAGDVGPQGSIAKLNTVRLNQAATELCVDLLGEEGMLFGSYSLADSHLSDYGYDTPMRAYLRARANSIEGGTSEILHNILGERVLGLPAEPRVDKDISWREAATR